jgi:hypothetical protein
LNENACTCPSVGDSNLHRSIARKIDGELFPRPRDQHGSQIIGSRKFGGRRIAGHIML